MEREKKSSVGGIRVKSIVGICIAICVIVISLIYSEISRINKNCQALICDTENSIEGQRCAVSLERSSDYLTENVRLFVIQQDVENMQLYFQEVEGRNRENMLARLETIFRDTDPETIDRLKEALKESHELETLEVHAMRLISYGMKLPEEQLPGAVAAWELTEEEKNLSETELSEAAYDLVFGEEYLLAKKRIKADVNGTLDEITDEMNRRQVESAEELEQTFLQQRVPLFSVFLLLLVVFWMIIAQVLYPMRDHIRAIQDNKKWKMTGAFEIRYLAEVYNRIYDKNEAYKKELEYKATHDALTGIYNREAFENRKDQLREKNLDVALILADINDFKSVNDTCGHKVGDETIRKVAESFGRLRLRGKYCVARIGGDEFAMFLQGVTQDYFTVIEKEIRKMNQYLGNQEGEIPKISVCAGVAFSRNGYSNELFRKADQALYWAKEHDYQNAKLYDPSVKQQRIAENHDDGSGTAL